MRYQRIGWCMAAAALTVSCAGCTSLSYSEKAKLGITYYAPGAGNIDFTDGGIRNGLQAAGYKGEIATFLWTISLNPLIDQTIRLNAKLRAQQLSRIIENYADKYPGKPINVIGLSAGTGVGIWAIEDLKPGVMVENVVLLGSSLWYRYDVSKALQHIRGKIYCYYSPNDAVLAVPMKVAGSIDGVFGEDGAGSVGLQPAKGRDRIVNIAWRPEFQRYGYNGGHTDGASPEFVKTFLAKHIMQEAEGPQHADAANPPAKAAPDGRPDSTPAAQATSQGR